MVNAKNCLWAQYDFCFLRLLLSKWWRVLHFERGKCIPYIFAQASAYRWYLRAPGWRWAAQSMETWKYFCSFAIERKQRIRTAIAFGRLHVCQLLAAAPLHIHIQLTNHKCTHDKPNWISKSKKYTIESCTRRTAKTETRVTLGWNSARNPKLIQFELQKNNISFYRIEIVPNFFSKFKPSSLQLRLFSISILRFFVLISSSSQTVAVSGHVSAMFRWSFFHLVSFFSANIRLKYLWRCQYLPSAKRTNGHVCAHILRLI